MLPEKENILRILKESKDAIGQKDSNKLKKLSDQTIHTAAIHQDSCSVVVSVLIYTLSKLMARDNYWKMEGWDIFYSSLNKNLDLAISSLEEGDYEKLMSSLGKIRNSVNKIEGGLSNYIKDVFYKAQVNKAFRLYEHGLSSEQTASILGVSLWDLASYIGQSSISESSLNEAVPVRERVKLAENFFK